MTGGSGGVVLHGVSKSYGDQVLFENVSFTIGTGERIGLLGRNGHGKSTLFRLLMGTETPDEGLVSIPKGYRIGHLSQHISQHEATVRAEAALGLPEEERETPYQAERVLDGLGFDQSQLSLRPDQLSGGYRLRLELAKLLVAQPNLLLLDEPTNYLDIEAIRWLRSELRGWPGELMMISHDRDFLDGVTTHTAGIYRRRIRKCAGSTGDLRALLQSEDEVYLRTREANLRRKKEIEDFAARYRAQASKAKLVQSRLKELDKLDIGDALGEEDQLAFSFAECESPPKRFLEAQDLGFGYGEAASLFEQVNLLVQGGDRVGVIGRNGKGKSTLLRCLIGELVPRSGTVVVHDRVRVGYFGQSAIDTLRERLTVEAEVGSSNAMLSRTAVRSICGAVMFPGARAERSVSVLSGGERSRVLLGKLIAQPSNLLVLDEPTNHLDIEAVEGLIDALQRFSGAVIVVTHNEYFLRKLATKIIAFWNGGVEVFSGTYQEFCEQRGFRDSAEIPRRQERHDGAAASRSAGPSKQKKANPHRLKQLETRFASLEAEVAATEEAIQKASASGHIHELLGLVATRDKLEAEQLTVLEEIERLGSKG